MMSKPPDPRRATTPLIRFQRAVARANRMVDPLVSGLAEAVNEYVAALKADGLLPEAVILSVKDAMAGAGVEQVRLARSPIVERVVSLAIEDYYRASPSGPATL